MLWLGIFGILYLAYCAIGGIVSISAWERRTFEDPSIDPQDSVSAALMEGAFWPAEAWRTYRGREAGAV